MPLEALTSLRQAARRGERSGARREFGEAQERAWVNPAWAWLVEAYSLDRWDGIAKLAQWRTVDEATRYVSRRCELAGASGMLHGVRIQVERAPTWRERGYDLCSGRGSADRIRQEFMRTAEATIAGFRTLELLSCAPRDADRPGWLAAMEPANALALATWLADQETQHPTDRVRLLVRVGRELARWHGAGFKHGRLNANRLLLAGDPRRPEIVLTQLDRTTAQTSLSVAERAAELSGVLATLPLRSMTRSERAALIDAYCAAAAMPISPGVFRRRLDDEQRRPRTCRELWEACADDSGTDGAARLEIVERGRMWCDPQDRIALGRLGLVDFDAVLATAAGRQFRALDDRENWRLELRGDGARYGAYLKKHHTRNWLSRLWAGCRQAPLATPGRIEAQNVARLQRTGIPTMRLIAFGERLHGDGRLESFVLTEELRGYAQLDQFLRDRFGARESSPGRTDPELARLIRAVAKVAQRFHQWRHNHRDFYCCHFFIREPRRGEFDVRLIDLQRVQSGRWLRTWWVLKDLTQLAYSAPRELIGCRERVLFLRHYFGVKKLAAAHKRLVRRIRAKQRWREWRLGPGDAPGPRLIAEPAADAALLPLLDALRGDRTARKLP